MSVYKKDGFWHVVMNGVLLERGTSLAAIKAVLKEHWH